MRITKALVEDRIKHRIAEYKEKAGRAFDPGNGWAQVPKGNIEAAVAYGAIRELESLLL